MTYRKAYVICCNDSIEFVVLEHQDIAEMKMKELQKELYARSRGDFTDWTSYINTCYWHIHETEVM